MNDQSAGFSDSRLVSWPWRALLLVWVDGPPIEDERYSQDRVLFVAPTAQGLEALERSEKHIESMWILGSDGDETGRLHAEQVQDISTWNPRTAGGRQVSVLRGESGRLICIDGENLFVLEPRSTDWTGSGPYRRLWSIDTGAGDGTGA